MNKYLKLAYKSALAYDYDPSLEFWLCAVLVKGGSVLSIGYNQRETHALIDAYRASEFCNTMHAEVDAVLKARKKIRLEGCKIYVIRLRRDKTLGMARPCAMCRACMSAYGIKKMFYTLDEHGTFAVESLKNESL